VDTELLESLIEDTLAEWLDDDLDALIDVGLLLDEGPTTVTFSNRLVREAVIVGVGPRKLRRMHRHAAQARAARQDPRETGLVGEHWHAAGDMEKAVEAWLQAYERSLKLGQFREASRWGRHALLGLSPEDPRWPRVVIVVGRSLRNDAELQAAADIIEPVLAHPDADLALEAGELLGEILQERTDFDGWAELLERLEPRVDAATAVGRAAWLRARAFWLNTVARFDEARDAAVEALSLVSDGLPGQTATQRLVWACLSTGRWGEALDAVH